MYPNVGDTSIEIWRLRVFKLVSEGKFLQTTTVIQSASEDWLGPTFSMEASQKTLDRKNDPFASNKLPRWTVCFETYLYKLQTVPGVLFNFLLNCNPQILISEYYVETQVRQPRLCPSCWVLNPLNVFLQGQHALQHPNTWPKDPHLHRCRGRAPLLRQMRRQPLQSNGADEAAATGSFGHWLWNLLQLILGLGWVRPKKTWQDIVDLESQIKNLSVERHHELSTLM